MDLIAQCPLRVASVVWRPGHGGYAFTVVSKATFELRPGLSPLAAAQDAAVEADVYTCEGGGLTLATDLVPLKKRPEVLVVGSAYAPEGRPAPSIVARLAVQEIDKAIQVVGDQYAEAGGRLSAPVPFTRMPLVWERAAGGPGTENPAGMPLGDPAWADATGYVAAPNLLPVGVTLTSVGALVPPVGFGPIAPLWPSRAAFLQRHAEGWSPSRWHERPIPADIDLAYFNASPLDQQRASPFGEETIYLENLHPRFARLSTRLAPVTPVVTVDKGAGAEPLRMRCDTLVIDTDRGLAILVWRGHALISRPDEGGRVIVTSGAAPAASPPASRPASRPASPPAAPPAPAHKLSEDSGTILPAAFIASSAVLPFSSPPPSRPPPSPSPSPYPSPSPAPAIPASVVSAPVPVIDAPAPLIDAPSPAAPAPPASISSPASAPEVTPEPVSAEARLRVIQRAIWKGDRPLQEILAEHGLTELEWRAMKRASTRKPGA
jgi:hypothetical protein